MHVFVPMRVTLSCDMLDPMNAVSDAGADLIKEIRRTLLALARREDELAAAEAAGIPYWEPCPPSVYGHRTAADVLRSEAESLTAA